MIKLKGKQLECFEESWIFDLEYNGKKVKVRKYTKQDSTFNDYDYDVEILESELTDEEAEEVIEYVGDLEWETEVDK